MLMYMTTVIKGSEKIPKGFDPLLGTSGASCKGSICSSRSKASLERPVAAQALMAALKLRTSNEPTPSLSSLNSSASEYMKP